jgi:hypothetical protein
VAVERWQRFTGNAAVLDGSDEDFNDLKDQHLSPCASASVAAS